MAVTDDKRRSSVPLHGDVSTPNIKAGTALFLPRQLAPLGALTSEVRRVLGSEARPLLRQIVEGEDRRYRANRHAGAAVDAFYGIDVEHLRVRVGRFILLGVNAIDRTS